MDAIKTFLPALIKIAKNNPKLAFFLTLIGFLIIVFHGALSIASAGILIFFMYVLLSVFALFALILFLLLNNLSATGQKKS